MSEANIFLEDEDFETCIPGYRLITSNSLDTLGYTRMVALVKDRIQVEIEGQWMSPQVASIWLKIVKKGGRKLFLCGIYRENKLLRQQQPNLTDDEILQTDRWDQFLNQWILASQQGDVIVMGDTNLDELKWAAPDQINVRMVNLVKQKI